MGAEPDFGRFVFTEGSRSFFLDFGEAPSTLESVSPAGEIFVFLRKGQMDEGNHKEQKPGSKSIPFAAPQLHRFSRFRSSTISASSVMIFNSIGSYNEI
jgi:hypothetical protein